MLIELNDIDFPYTVMPYMNATGIKLVEIRKKDADENSGIVLDKELCIELAETLKFVADRL